MYICIKNNSQILRTLEEFDLTILIHCTSSATIVSVFFKICPFMYIYLGMYTGTCQ